MSTPSTVSTPSPAPIPTSNLAVQALTSQVGGHAGVMTTEDGSLLIKPASPQELAFYQRLQIETSRAFALLREHTPKFLGTLTLEGQATGSEGEGGQLQIKPASDRTESIVLENLSHGFTRPNIMDVKLGTVLYDEKASEEKKQRMINTARNTTSLETGVRLTGFQVHDNNTGLAVNTPKSYGKSIKVSELPEGIARFFPIGRPAEPTPTEVPNLGLPARTLLPILRAIREEIEEIKDALSDIEMRMVGGSLLIVYEGDWEKADEGIKKYLEDREKAKAAAASGKDAGEEDEDEEEEEEEDDDEENGPPPALVVKLIDFAHTKVEAGLGRDEGVLLGITTVLKLLDGRIEQVQAQLEAEV